VYSNNHFVRQTGCREIIPIWLFNKEVRYMRYLL
jgi:hypothetical protein